MIINHNITALNTHRQMGAATNAQANSMEKLSSGLRINSAKDDAAGLSISEKMRGQIRGLEQASKNSQDAISLMQTAEGALNETHDILQRMRELSVQASNETNTETDRKEMQKEIDQLASEVDRIGNATEFNTKKLLNGSVGVQASTDAPTQLQSVSSGSSTTAGTYNISNGNLATYTTGTGAATAIGNNLAADGAITGATTIGSLAGAPANTAAGVNINGTSFTFDATKSFDAIRDEINAKSSETGVTVSHSITNNADATPDTVEWTFSAIEAGTTGAVSISGGTGVLAGAVTTTTGTNASFTIVGTDEDSATIALNAGDYTVEGNEVKFTAGDAEGLKFTLTDVTGGNIVVSDNNQLSFQIGANEGQNLNVAIQDMRAKALNVDSIDVTTTNGANSAITTINEAIESVSSERSKLGAFQNRLDHTINNLNTSSENLTAAESRIRDVDMAKEMMNQTKNSILAQAAQAMLAQANQAPQQVLQLLR